MGILKTLQTYLCEDYQLALGQYFTTELYSLFSCSSRIPSCLLVFTIPNKGENPPTPDRARTLPPSQGDLACYQTEPDRSPHLVTRDSFEGGSVQGMNDLCKSNWHTLVTLLWKEPQLTTPPKKGISTLSSADLPMRRSRSTG